MEQNYIVVDSNRIEISANVLHKLSYYGIQDNFDSLSILGNFQRIDDGAFQDSQLKNVYIGDRIQLGKYAFNNCRKLRSVRLPIDVDILESSTFENCISLSSIENIENYTTIKNNAFDGCVSLTSVDVRNATCLGDSVFGSCGKLSTVIVSDKLQHVGYDEFVNCYKLLSIDIKSNISFKISSFDEDLSRYIFAKNPNLEEKYAVMLHNRSYNRSQYIVSTLHDRLNDDPLVNSNDQYELVISGVSCIYPCMFEHNYSISSVIIADDIIEIGDYAFHRCHNLKKIKFSKNLKRIGNFAFGSCISLQNADLPVSLEEIGTSGFNKCSALLSIDLKNVSIIGNDSFSDCMHMETAILNKCQLGYMAFADCVNLKNLIANQVCIFRDLSFIDCIQLSNIKNSKIVYLDGAKIFEFNLLKALSKRISRIGDKIMLLPYGKKV